MLQAGALALDGVYNLASKAINAPVEALGGPQITPYIDTSAVAARSWA
jgi:hypothetical protein